MPLKNRGERGQAVRGRPFGEVDRQAGAVAVQHRDEDQRRRGRDQGGDQPLFEMIERPIEQHAFPASQTDTAGSAIAPGRFRLAGAAPSSVHLDVEFFGEQIEHLLPDAALRPLVGRLHRLLPRLALIVGQIVQRGLAGSS